MSTAAHSAARALPRFVLIPGWGASSLIWKDQAERLSKLTRVVIVDPRSQGSQTITAEGITPRQRARDLQKVLLQLGIDDRVREWNAA